MKVLNISKYLPIKGFPAENDITFKIYDNLKKEFKINSLFVMPLTYIPIWATYLKRSLRSRYKIIHDPNYKDKKYGFQVKFYQAFFPLKFINSSVRTAFWNMRIQFNFSKGTLFKMFQSYKPDIIHAHTLNDGFFAYRLHQKFNIPYLITLRGSYSEFYKIQEVQSILTCASHLMTPSFNLFENLNKKYDLELLPHGLEDNWFLNFEKKFDVSRLRLVSVCRLLGMKNIQIILQSLAILKNEGVKFQYAIIGDGPYKEVLQNLVIQLNLVNEVKFYGFRTPEEIREIYRNFDIFIMLSNSETFGRVYFEAAAQSLLVIGKKGTGADGYFKPDEALFIEPTVDSTVDTLKKLNLDLLAEMTAKSRKRMDDFQNNMIIKRYHQILQNTLN